MAIMKYIKRSAGSKKYSNQNKQMLKAGITIWNYYEYINAKGLGYLCSDCDCSTYWLLCKTYWHIRSRGCTNGLTSGGYYGTGYNGGAVVTNSVAVVNAASANEKAVYFAFDSSALDSQAQAVLDQRIAY